MLHLLFSDLLFLSDDNEQSRMLTAFKFNNQPIEGELRLGGGMGLPQGNSDPRQAKWLLPGSRQVSGGSLG